MVTIPNRDGHYPLQISIANQQVFSTTKQIFDAYPSMGRVKIGSDGLVAFKLAAVGFWEDDVDQINTIFYLLQQDPVV